MCVFPVYGGYFADFDLQPIDHYPALLAKDDARITVVGAVDNAGNPFEGGMYDADIVKVSGPGDHIKGANKDGDYDYNVEGTSARKCYHEASGLELTDEHSDRYDSWSTCGFHDGIRHDIYPGTESSVRQGLQ